MEITSNVETGTIISNATVTVEKADGEFNTDKPIEKTENNIVSITQETKPSNGKSTDIKDTREKIKPTIQVIKPTDTPNDTEGKDDSEETITSTTDPKDDNESKETITSSKKAENKKSFNYCWLLLLLIPVILIPIIIKSRKNKS